MIRHIMAISLLALSSCSSLEPAFAQQQSYVPIVLDEAKFNAFFNTLSEVPMNGKAWQQIVSILQGLERDAIQEKSKSDATLKGKEEAK